MLKWAITFALIALVAGMLGFTGIAGAWAFIAKLIFFIAIIVPIVGFVLIKGLLS